MSDADSNLINEHYYVVGKIRDSKEIAITEYVNTEFGWKQTCLNRNVKHINANYMCNETWNDLQKWILCDYRSRFSVYTNFEAAEECLHRMQ